MRRSNLRSLTRSCKLAFFHSLVQNLHSLMHERMRGIHSLPLPAKPSSPACASSARNPAIPPKKSGSPTAIGPYSSHDLTKFMLRGTQEGERMTDGALAQGPNNDNNSLGQDTECMRSPVGLSVQLGPSSTPCLLALLVMSLANLVARSLRSSALSCRPRARSPCCFVHGRRLSFVCVARDRPLELVPACGSPSPSSPAS